MILFYKRVVEIIRGFCYLQCADNVLIGSKSLEELRLIPHQMFAYFNDYGIKVNLITKHTHCITEFG